MPDGAPLYMAGVFREEKDIPLPLFVILTREATTGLAHIHDRMPVILSGKMQREWLSSRCDVRAVLDGAMQGFVSSPVDVKAAYANVACRASIYKSIS